MAFQWAKDVGVHSYAQIEATANRSGIDHKVSSDFRPGSITITGNISYHARGNAVDFVSSKALMVTFAQWWAANYGPYILELIHSGPGAPNIKNGAAHKYSQDIVNQHYDHVHVAITLSGLAAASAAPTGNIINVSSPSGPQQTAGCAIPAMIGALALGSGAWTTVEILSRVFS